MGANPDQQVDPAALKLAAKGRGDTINELSSLLGSPSGQGNEGGHG